MKTQSVEDVKRGRWSSNLKPREGTHLRAAFDLFQSHRGVTIDFIPSPGWRDITQLQDTYGMDIRHIGRNRWLLAGEWFGPTYVDYVADRFHAAERPQ